MLIGFLCAYNFLYFFQPFCGSMLCFGTFRMQLSVIKERKMPDLPRRIYKLHFQATSRKLFKRN